MSVPFPSVHPDGDTIIPEEWYSEVYDATEIGTADGEFDYTAPILEEHANDERRR
eukprot:IDg1777t1